MRSSAIHITLILLASVMFAPMKAQPRLTVVAVVDGLRYEDMTRLHPFLSSGGLRLMAEEAQHTQVCFHHEIYGGVETVASMLTAEEPKDNAVAMDYCFSVADKQLYHSLYDPTETGIGSHWQLSPRSVLTPLLSDYYRSHYGTNAKIYSVGQDAATTVLLAGHSADGCCWLDSVTKQWATTSFYRKGLPVVADEINMSGIISETMQKIWQPRMYINMYTCPTEQEQRQGFAYSQERYLHSSPAVNRLVVDLALRLQEEQQLGMHPTNDVLFLQFTVSSPQADGDFICSAEQEDMYLWLNQDFGYLIEQLHKRLGDEEMEVCLMGVPRKGVSLRQRQAVGMPVRRFSIERAAALTNAYLMALYGHERWVEGSYGNTLFLNHQLIEERQMSLKLLEEQVADFLMEFEGVAMAYPRREATNDAALSPLLAKRWAGDVVLRLQTGWQLVYNEYDIIDNVVELHPAVPLYLWDSNVAKRQLRVALPEKITTKEMLGIIIP